MAGSTVFYKAVLILLSITQFLVTSLAISPRAVGSVLTISLARLTLSAATETAETAVVDADAHECIEPGTCGDSDNANVDTASDSETNDGQTNTNNEPSDLTPAKFAPNGDRLISSEELALYPGKEEGSTIWLSILGKVFDVTTGPEFYSALNGGYKFYAGRDASPCFGSGINTEEGAQEKLEEWEDKKLMPVWEWSTFYEDHETYKYLGVLAGSRYFDKQGNETPVRKDIVRRASEAKRIADEERDRKRKERQAAREARKKQKK
mmetsp:Transcript_30450/g.73446  ORF Transcript_30450/g.73446 Transcript_30450/m.73446 type:complete len:265 (+) Transcript_30450:187-981(+)|eukprot:CAMPEP_0181076536 /NCGR_PEP_ID=MMETSP1071-20121207/472_1 /TAXON_ID=35127 /ORGANISM="Thalassiosira sp., Strain NH16" /LENGTH=264 /DNA_ID=CAMNT_0023157725 /DNA_START=98 /DNA_END=892 /DNA_ORIENTATION=-